MAGTDEALHLALECGVAYAIAARRAYVAMIAAWERRDWGEAEAQALILELEIEQAARFFQGENRKRFTRLRVVPREEDRGA